MGEKSRSIGEKLEGFGQDLYSFFKWNELLRDKEIPCRRSTHKNTDKSKKKTHGIDLLHTCFDPYKNRRLAIITECKNYQWKSITDKKISEWIEELVNTIDCASVNEDISQYSEQFDIFNTGILLIHGNDGFNKDDFYGYLQKVKYPSRRSPINIYIAGNDRIEQWIALNDYINVNYRHGEQIFKFVYPFIGENKYSEHDHITINHLFSRFIFARREYYKDDGFQKGKLSHKEPCEQYIVFCFDTFSEEAYKYVCSMFKYFQFEKAHEYVFCFYPQKEQDIEHVKKNFLNVLNKAEKHYSLDVSKVKYDFLINPRISRVNY